LIKPDALHPAPKHLLIIAGPAASGKSATALAIASRLGEFVLIVTKKS
jgi:tRNA A37 N6-isopentenylltransferase MiaA